MDEIEKKLDIFQECNIINKDEKNILEMWISLIKYAKNNCNEEMLERLITHSAMMMKRKNEKETMDVTLSDEIFSSVISEEVYDDCAKLFDKMNALYPIDDNEKRYILLHLCSCLKGDDYE